MGARNKQKAENITYYSVMDGKFITKVDKGTEGSVTRKNKKGKTVTEMQFEEIFGKITNVKVKEHEEFGKRLIINLIDNEGAEDQIEMPLSSSYAFGFLNRIANPALDLSKEVSLKVYDIEDKEKEGKIKKHFVIYQNGQKIENHYTKENPNGLPELVETQDEKKPYDDTARNEFFEKYISTELAAKISTASTVTP